MVMFIDILNFFSNFSTKKKKKICPSGPEKDTQSGGRPETILFFRLALHVTMAHVVMSNLTVEGHNCLYNYSNFDYGTKCKYI